VNLIFVTGFVLATLVLLALAWQLRALALEVYAGAKAAAASGPDHQGIPLNEVLQQRLDEFTATLRGWGLQVGDWRVPDIEGLTDQAQEWLAEYAGQAGRAGLVALRAVLVFLAHFLGGVFSVLALFFLVPLYTYYFLFVIGDLHGSIQRYFPRRE